MIDDNQLEKIKNFQWEDEVMDHMPDFDFAQKIIDCAESISKFVLSNIKNDYFEYDLDSVALSIPIKEDVHSIIKECKNSDWSQESRSAVFQVLDSVFCNNYSDSISFKSQVSQKIKDNINPKYKVSWMNLYDDFSIPGCELEGVSCGEIIFEIGLEE